MSGPTPREIAASEELRTAVSRRSDTVAEAVAKLDEWAIAAGSFRISIWDVMVFCAIVIVCFLLAKLASRWVRALVRRTPRLDSTQQLLTEKLLTIAIWAAAGFLVIDLTGIDLTALAVFSGAFGLAIGFGLQKTFGNLIAGMILLMDKSIKPGDVIVIADQAGQSTFGQIRKIGVRAVSLVTRDQKEYLIPNENLMINQVENWSYSSRQVRIQIPVGVSYDADMDLAERLMLEAAHSADRVLANPAPKVWMKGFGASSVDFIIHCWIEDPEEGIGNVQSSVLKALWKLFKTHDIEVPFAQQDVHLRQSEPLDRIIAALERQPGDPAG